MSTAAGVVMFIVGLAMCAGYIVGLNWLMTSDSWLERSFAFTLGSLFGVVLLWFVGGAIGVSGLVLIFGGAS